MLHQQQLPGLVGSTPDTDWPGETTPNSEVMVLRWDQTTGWAWLAHGQGPTSRFAGFVQLADPSALPTHLAALGWDLVDRREVRPGLAEAVVGIPLHTVSPPRQPAGPSAPMATPQSTRGMKR